MSAVSAGEGPVKKKPKVIVTEVQMYKALPKVDVEGDPLRWWATQSYALPVLSFMARQHWVKIPISVATFL